MSTGNPESLHGTAGSGLGGFSRLLPADTEQASIESLSILAECMVDLPDQIKAKPDPEENLYVPAGYTYFGQFIDHDLTFDTTSTLDVRDNSEFTNQRSPRFDLDNLYGAGPDAAPYMYQDGIRLVQGNGDLPRQAGRAIIGDPRNDENSIVCNLQMEFIAFHNAVVDKLEADCPHLKGTRALFNKARNEVRWTYQRIIVDDFLPRIVSNETLMAFEVRRDPNAMGRTRNEAAYRLYTAERRGAIPLEFSGAAYRFGHSMVRNGYFLNDEFSALIFAKAGKQDPDASLVGFQPLPSIQRIKDWSIFFPDPNGSSLSKTPGAKDLDNTVGSFGDGDKRRLQFAYRIDTSFVNPLAFLPSSVAGEGGLLNLGLRNLLRGRKYQLPSGQAVANVLGVRCLEPNELASRLKDEDSGLQSFERIAPEFIDKTPLWYYILAEAQLPLLRWAQALGESTNGKTATFDEDALIDNASKTATQLGEMGGRIVLEVFHGLLDSDPDSYRNHHDAGAWTPLIKEFRMWHLVNRVFA